MPRRVLWKIRSLGASDGLHQRFTIESRLVATRGGRSRVAGAAGSASDRPPAAARLLPGTACRLAPYRARRRGRLRDEFRRRCCARFARAGAASVVGIAIPAAEHDSMFRRAAAAAEEFARTFVARVTGGRGIADPIAPVQLSAALSTGPLAGDSPQQAATAVAGTLTAIVAGTVRAA